MNAQEIRDAVDAGKIVHWSNRSYTVINGGVAGYLIRCEHKQHCIGLTWTDGVTLNGKPEDFYVVDDAYVLRGDTHAL